MPWKSFIVSLKPKSGNHSMSQKPKMLQSNTNICNLNLLCNSDYFKEYAYMFTYAYKSSHWKLLLETLTSSETYSLQLSWIAIEFVFRYIECKYIFITSVSRNKYYFLITNTLSFARRKFIRSSGSWEVLKH